MRTLRPTLLLPLLGGLVFAGCEDTGPTEPALDELATLTVEEELTLDVLSDPTTIEAALGLADAQTGAAHRRGRAWSSSNDLLGQAEHQFREAHDAFAKGEVVRAMEQHREGRRLVAEAMQGSGGAWALQAQLERLEALPISVAADPDGFHNANGFAHQLGTLAQGARGAHQAGNRIQGGQLGVLGEQAVRKRQRDQDGTMAGRPSLKVALGSEAVELAKRLIDGEVVSAEQMDLLAVAEEFQAKAEEALENGNFGRAVHFAHQAQWWALKAVILPGGITDEDARSILELAKTLFDEAVGAVGDDPTELQAALLRRASSMVEAGKTALESGNVRGLGALWQAAVICSFLLS